jgi:GntR family transcriptional regulator
MTRETMIERDSQQKLYVQIYNILKSRVETGEWLPGTQIPTEDDLCRTYDISRATVRNAISELVREGYFRRQQGKGTFVTYSRSHSGMAMKTRLTENMFGEGVRVKKELLIQEVKEPPEDIRKHLKGGGAVHYVLCKRLVNGDPAYLEESCVPISVVPEMDGRDICRFSLYDLIQERGLRKICKVVQTIEVAEIRGETSVILKVDDGSPALLLHRLLVGSDGSTIAYTKLIGSGRKYKIQTEFERIK